VPSRSRPPPSLELTEAEFREMVETSVVRLETYLRELPERPMHHMDGAQRLVRSLREPWPEQGVRFRRLLGTLFERVIPYGLNTASSGYLAYIPGGGLVHAGVADLIANVTNRYIGLWQAAPGLVQLETNVIRWFADLIGLPPGSGGLLTTGGSLANLAAVVAARHDRLGERFDDGVIYVSELVHHSVFKSARVAGFRADQVRAIPVDGAFRLDVAALAAAIAEDRAAGRRPALVVASAGTTATGAVDPLPALADLCAAEGLWLHVDGAYGGFFQLTERGRTVLTGIERADSVTLDPHKGLFLPYGTGCILVRDLGKLRAAHQIAASYLPASEQDPDCWDFADLGPELSRDNRGLRVWIPLKMHGASGFRAQLDEKLDLAERACARLRELPEIEIVAPPELSLFAFRVRADQPGSGDPLTRRLAKRVNARNRVIVTGVEVGGRWLLRVCVPSFRTHAADLEAFHEDLVAGLAELD
jgi:aromatic-L-amino-acid decarboxylase